MNRDELKKEVNDFIDTYPADSDGSIDLSSIGDDLQTLITELEEEAESDESDDIDDGPADGGAED